MSDHFISSTNITFLKGIGQQLLVINTLSFACQFVDLSFNHFLLYYY